MTKFKDFVRSLLLAVTDNTFVRVLSLGLVRIRLLPEGIWKRLPIQREFSVSLADGGSFKYLATAKDGIGRTLFWGGIKYWEPETTEIFYKLAQKANLILDIGANTGLFTLLACAANKNSQVISFEPVPHVYKLLVSQIEVNSWEDRCQPRNEAVSNNVGWAKFHVPFENVPKSASLNLQGFRGYAGDLIDVPMTTIDTVCYQNQQVDLIKIDVEGFEDKVLEGMQQVLANYRPNIIVECNLDGPFLAVQTILSSLNYRFFHLRKEGPVPVDRIVPDRQEVYRNFLCTVRDDWGEFK